MPLNTPSSNLLTVTQTAGIGEGGVRHCVLRAAVSENLTLLLGKLD